MLMKYTLAPLLLVAASVAMAETAPKKPRHAAAPREELKSEVAEEINENQLAIASRVLTGRASCEFDQHVSVEPVQGKPGLFHVGFKNATYHMVPEETSSGAVRLLDKRSGVVWLQIPSKSMLMNSKVGQRMVDNCTQNEQRVAGK